MGQLDQCEKTEVFLKKAKEVHGDTYDYSNSIYLGSGKKLSIYCKSCNTEFEQTAGNHLSGRGCPECAKKNKFTTQNEFKEKAQKLHGNQYDYSGSLYISAHKNITILCNGCKQYFEQTPNNHLLGSGCSKCNKGRSILTNEEFIAKATEVHGDRYDYSNSVYLGSHKDIFIRCNICLTTFKKNANNHLNGQGCSCCRRELNQAKFEEKAKEVHGDQYDYSNSIYLGSHKKLTIHCNRCNQDFEQSANSHLSGQKCSMCSKMTYKNELLDQEKFKLKAKEVHGDKYDYTNTVLVGIRKKLFIHCNRCNQKFEQIAKNHLDGRGCPTCAKKHKLVLT